MNLRIIPASGEHIAAIGVGTYRAFDRKPSAETNERLGKVLSIAIEPGMAMVDTSPMYGEAESLVGELLSSNPNRGNAFLATKIWTHGRAEGAKQVERSFQLLKTDRIDLVQVHNLVDFETHLQTIDGLKESGAVRYSGLTHYSPSAHPRLEAAMVRSRVDFIQLNYSLEDRAAEQRLLPMARDLGIAVIVNLPFGGGELLRRLSREPLPGFAAEIGCTAWSQLLLRFVLGHTAITCVIPGTGSPDHMRQNVDAAAGDPMVARSLLLEWMQRRA